MGRPLRDRRNNWNDDWYKYMRRIATDVLRHTGMVGRLDEDDLISTAWYMSARYNPQDICVTRMGPSIRRAMLYEVYGSIKHPITVVEEDEILLPAKGIFTKFDDVLDAVDKLTHIELEPVTIICMRAAGYNDKQIGTAIGKSREYCRQKRKEAV